MTARTDGARDARFERPSHVPEEEARSRARSREAAGEAERAAYWDGYADEVASWEAT